MGASPETYLTVRQHADDLARECHPRSWRQHRNEPLDQLFPAIWLDQFEDKATHSLLLGPDEVKQHRKGFAPLPDRTPVRVLLWRIKGGDYWIPDAVRNARQNEYLWQEMADLSWEDYDEAYRRRRIEQVVILGSAFKRWKDRYWTGRRERPGRKEGSGSYAHDDAPLLDKMSKLIANGDAKSPWNAATKVADEARGTGVPESTVRRLYRKYQSRFRRQ